MATPTSGAIIAASRDTDLLHRLVALAATLDQPLTQAEIEEARVRLAAAPADDAGNTIASVYEYAALQLRYRPGQDPAGVTDEHLRHALATLTD